MLLSQIAGRDRNWACFSSKNFFGINGRCFQRLSVLVTPGSAR